VESTRGITAQCLQQRLDPGHVPQELRDLVQALNAMLDRLNHAFERLSRFSADLAHELRTPITNLMGETEVALSRERPIEEYRQVLESSMDEYRRLSRLISRMLFLARAEDPGAAIIPVPIEARRLLDEVLAFYEAAGEEQGVRLSGEADGTLQGDADMLRQALANLVSNALAATPEGGEIIVRVKQGDGHAELEVRDTGRGIPEAELPHVFDRFYRTGEAFARKAPGTGLGLALVQSIARLHGGDVRITSEVGKGTRVNLRFPG
jgi:two-component system heavy metal sensor histidine kinase CusS